MPLARLLGCLHKRFGAGFDSAHPTEPRFLSGVDKRSLSRVDGP